MPDMMQIECNFGETKTSIQVSLGAVGEAKRLIGTACDRVLPAQVVVLTDQNVGPLYLSRLQDSIAAGGAAAVSLQVPAGERAKSLEVLAEVYAFLANSNLGRDGLIVALGGGVISDLAGFVAATWMRGVDFAIFPTTLEAAIDASIGGKTGINLKQGKNLVGAFHQPVLVAVDPECLNTLDTRDVCAGMAESIKHGLITGEAFTKYQELHADQILALDPDTMRELITENIRIKSRIVESDVREQSDRRIFLNFGHTIGHAIESCCGYSFRHGECVALGMMAACRLSVQKTGLDTGVLDRVEALLQRFHLPIVLSESIGADDVVSAIANDKKNRDCKPRFVLLEEIGRPVICDDVSEAEIRAAYESLKA